MAAARSGDKADRRETDYETGHRERQQGGRVPADLTGDGGDRHGATFSFRQNPVGIGAIRLDNNRVASPPVPRGSAISPDRSALSTGRASPESAPVTDWTSCAAVYSAFAAARAAFRNAVRKALISRSVALGQAALVTITIRSSRKVVIDCPKMPTAS